MAAAAATKKKNDCSQKYDGGAPSGGISSMTVSVVPEKKNNKYG